MTTRFANQRAIDPGRVADVIRTRREQLGMTQRDLSATAGYSRCFVAKLECGKCALPSVYALSNVCTALGLTMSELFATQ